MAWVEQRHGSWRVRYRASGITRSVSGFRSRTEAENFAADMATDRRRGVWIDPAGSAMPLEDWADRWVETLDVEARTEENYRGRLRNHTCRSGAAGGWGRSRQRR